jgi:PAS domain S-box-containing protein
VGAVPHSIVSSIHLLQGGRVEKANWIRRMLRAVPVGADKASESVAWSSVARQRPLLWLVLLVFILLGVLHGTVFYQWGTRPVAPNLAWTVPVTNTFLILTAWSVGFVSWGRYAVLRDPVSFWTAVGFSAFGTCLVFYVLAWPGWLPGGGALLGRRFGTPAWMVLSAGSMLGGSLLAAVCARWPGERALGRRWLWVVGAGLVSLVMMNLVVVALEDWLPTLVEANGRYTGTLRAWQGVVTALYAVGALASTRYYLRTGDTMPAYAALAQVVMFYYQLMASVVGTRYGFLLLAVRVLTICGFVAVLFGLLSEYVALFRREKDKTQALRESEDRLRLAQQVARVGTFDWDLDGGRLRWSPEMEALYGLEPGSFDGDWRKHVYPADAPAVERHLAQARERGSFEAEWRALLPGGALRWLAGRGQVLKDSTTGAAVRMIGVNFDISDRKHAEEAQALAETLRFKNRFLATISHELRTPLTLILAPARELQADADLAEHHRAELRVIERNARTLLRTVNDLLDLSRLDAGRLTLEYANTDLAWLARFVASHFETLAAERHLNLVVETPDALPAEVDPIRIQRVLFNLLGNAVKFTSDGGTVRLLVRAHEDRALLVVDDSGPGIPPEQREVIFERFRQLDATTTRGYGGSGLGLAIVREFADLHHGSVTAGDAPTGGARFTVDLPLRAPAGLPVRAAPVPLEQDAAETAVAELRVQQEAPPAAAADVAVHAPLVLVVEDNPEMKAFVASALRRQHRVATANDGEEGLEKALSLRPDLIVSDIMMPRLSGEEMTREVRRHHELDDVPILLLSARADDEARVRLLRSGAQDYLVKPFATEELLARAAGLVARKREAEARLHENYALLQKAHAELQEADRRRTEFLSMLSHELRNPLAAISNVTAILVRGATEPSRTRSLHAMLERQTRHLSRMVDDLLDVARITRGKIQIRKELVALDELVRQAADDARAMMDAKAHHLTVSAGHEITVDGDAARLREVLGNLLENAAKYTDPGGQVAVELEREGNEAVIRVRDNGAGMDSALLPHVFELFTQGPRALARSEGGLGIGLALVKRLVEMHGGNVAVESDAGRGSEFTVRLPVTVTEAPMPVQPARAGAIKGLRILIVEDNADAASSLATLLRLEGGETEIAYDGAQALRIGAQWRPDAILLDIGLPTTSGLEVCRALRRETWGKHVPIIAVTGWGEVDDEQQSKEAGFDGHLVKPVSAQAVVTLLADKLGQNSTAHE